MNDFIKLTLIKSTNHICVKKQDICSFEEDVFNNKKCTNVYLSKDRLKWIKVKETVDEIMEMLNLEYKRKVLEEKESD